MSEKAKKQVNLFFLSHVFVTVFLRFLSDQTGHFAIWRAPVRPFFGDTDQVVHMRVRICQPIRYKTTDFDSRNAYSCFTTNTRRSGDVCEKMKRRQKEIKAPSRLSKRRQGTERWI
ncbi:hypothetical protein L596_001792 [Steinernema carpocapsae]|uniref:Uncharacterized protein n=1 Tax=Steinernema carpocapsae TaxID=34508 RepID=A0A4U8UMJ2_STECR|nr:hypothetical protein L596_001792 [Steinernema carpocapsae]